MCSPNQSVSGIFWSKLMMVSKGCGLMQTFWVRLVSQIFRIIFPEVTRVQGIYGDHMRWMKGHEQYKNCAITPTCKGYTFVLFG